MALRASLRLRRIGAFIDPCPARAAGAVVTPAAGVVALSDLVFEAGSAPLDGHAELLPAARIARNEAFDAHCSSIVAEAKGAPPSVDTMHTLLSHGAIEQGMAVFEALDSGEQLDADDYTTALRGLACPALFRHHYAWAHDAMDACKMLGEHRGEDRARESEHVWERMLRRLPPLELQAECRDEELYPARINAWNAMLNVHVTAGYKPACKVPDIMYDVMALGSGRDPAGSYGAMLLPPLHLQPTMATYLAVLRALGLTTRMEECDAVWVWLSSRHADKLSANVYVTRLECLLEAERWVDVEELFVEMVERAAPRPNSRAFDVLCHSIWRYANHARGAIFASEEKKLIFFPTWMREQGVCEADLAPVNRRRISAALQRWTHRRGLAKTTEWMLDQKRREYEAWNEGQRWRHLRDEDINTSMIEAAVMRMRGSLITERMRADVQTGGGRGVIYPPPTHKAITRFDGSVGRLKSSFDVEQGGLARDMFGINVPPASAADAAAAAQDAHDARVQEAIRAESIRGAQGAKKRSVDLLGAAQWPQMHQDMLLEWLETRLRDGKKEPKSFADSEQVMMKMAGMGVPGAEKAAKGNRQQQDFFWTSAWALRAKRTQEFRRRGASAA